jgi:hypothetical protein
LQKRAVAVCMPRLFLQSDNNEECGIPLIPDQRLSNGCARVPERTDPVVTESCTLHKPLK